jgi:uncharacterized repeat protein (TIGR03806 family)
MRILPHCFRRLLSSCVLSGLACASSLAAQYGLDNAEPIGAYLNGVFPSSAPGPAGAWAVQRVFPNISLNLPTFAGVYPGTNKILVVEHGGRIKYFENNQSSSTTTMFLDISSRVYEYGDAGMTYFAFHPDFGKAGSPNRGYVYVTYKWRPSIASSNPHLGYLRVSRFTVPDGSMMADPNSEQILIQQFDRHEFHDCGCLLFGPDGYLYVGIGDEGDSNDSFNDSQKINDRLFSGILRIDVNKDPAKGHAIRRQPLPVPEIPAGWPPSVTQNYFIPNDNPFVNPDASVLEEFYALGFRNPYRFNTNPQTGEIWVGDVGQDTMEEVDLLVPGGNYGWAFREGSGPGPKPQPANIIGTLIEPKWTYGRNLGGCIVAGYFYQGQAQATLQGKLLIVDNTSGRIWALTRDANANITSEFLTTMPSGAVYSGTVTCVQDQNGEVYFLKLGDNTTGEFYKLTRTGTAVPEPPALLSQTGAFTNLASLTPRTGLIPYDVNSPLWSDAALKKRWLAVPNDGTHNTSAEKVKFAPDSEWMFPAGTVFVKHFELATDESNPNAIRKLETRFLVISATGEPYGVTYRWRPDGTEADLLSAGAEDTVSIALAGGGTRNQTWKYPSRADCMICHNSNAKYVLGLKTWQLNRDLLYPETGRTANQLATLGHIGMFDSGYHEEHIPYFLKAKNIADLSAPLETRVRSYIDANCAQCHRPNGVRANFDARFSTPLTEQHLIRGDIENSFTGQPESVIQPGDTTHSIMYRRASIVGTSQMPPLAKNLVDAQAMGEVQNWINSLSQGPTVKLTKTGVAGDGDFLIDVTFSNSVTGLTTSDFDVKYASVVSLTGSGLSYALRLKPTAGSSQKVLVELPAGTVVAGALANYASNKLTLEKIDSTLVTWLKLDETGGLVAADSSSAANDGQVSSILSTDWVTGKFGGALRFLQDGSRMALVNKLTDDFTLSFWINTTQAFPQTDLAYRGAPLFFADAGGQQNDIVISGTRTSGGLNRITFMTDTAGGGATPMLHGTTNVSTGQWVNVTIRRVKASGLMEIYINGVLDATRTGSTATLSANMVLETGHANAENTDYRGLIDQVRIYNRPLSQAEITALATETTAASTGIDAWYAAKLPGLTHLQDLDLDPDGDGLTNSAEYALNGDPLALTIAPLEIIPSPSGASTIRYLNRKGQSGLTYEIEMSPELSTWQPTGARLTNSQNTNSDDANYQWTSGTFIPTGTENSKFFRIKVTGFPE